MSADPNHNPYQAPATDNTWSPEPMSMVGSVLSQALRLVGGNWPLLVTIALLLWTPIYAVSNYMLYEAAMNDWTYILLMMPLDFIGECFVTAAVLAVMIRAADGQAPSFESAIRRSANVLLKFLVTYFICSFLIGLAALLLILPGIYLAIRLSLVDSIVVKEGRWGFSAIEGSFNLSSGNFWPLAGLGVMYFLLLAVPEVAYLVASEFYAPLDNWIAATISDLFTAILAMYPITFMYLAYRRIARRGSY